MTSLPRLALLAAAWAAAAASPHVRDALAADDVCGGGRSDCAFHALQHQQRWEVDGAGGTELESIVEEPPEEQTDAGESSMLAVQDEQSRSNSTCNTWTGGTCLTSGCAASRGATECSMARCVCTKGFCADSHGACVFDFQEAASQFGFSAAQVMAKTAAKERRGPEAGSFVRNRLKKEPNADLGSIAAALIRFCLRLETHDNLTVMIARLVGGTEWAGVPDEMIGFDKIVQSGVIDKDTQKNYKNFLTKLHFPQDSLTCISKQLSMEEEEEEEEVPEDRAADQSKRL